LKSLKEKGFVQQQLVSNLYVATPFEEASKLLVGEKHQEIIQLESQLSEIAKSLPRENDDLLLGKKELLLSNSKSFTFSKGQKYIDAATTQVDHMHTWRRFTQLWQAVEGHMAATMKRGIKVRQITEIPHDMPQALRFLGRPVFCNPNFEIRFVGKTGGNMTVVDNQRIFMSTSQDKENIGETPLLFSNYEGVVGLMRNYYEYCWLYGYRLIDGVLVKPDFVFSKSCI
jgi:sugar-specific transcriptional regulator TrmB